MADMARAIAAMAVAASMGGALVVGCEAGAGPQPAPDAGDGGAAATTQPEPLDGAPAPHAAADASGPEAAVMGGPIGALAVVLGLETIADGGIETPRLQGSPADLARLMEVAQGNGREHRYLVPSASEAAAFRDVVAEIVRGSDRLLDALIANQRGAARLGLELVHFELDGEPVAVIREIEGLGRGAGFYVIRRRSDARRLAIMAPHVFKDLDTGVVAFEAFRVTGAAALLVNTLRRDAAVENPSEAHSKRPADLAHAPGSFFQAATEVLSAELSRAVFVQLHGYAAKKHPELPKPLLVIPSRGNAYLLEDPLLDRFAADLEALLGKGTATVFGKGVRELGGTTNSQGRFLNSWSDDRFYHVEMERRLRRRLAKDADLRERFAGLLLRLGEGS